MWYVCFVKLPGVDRCISHRLGASVTANPIITIYGVGFDQYPDSTARDVCPLCDAGGEYSCRATGTLSGHSISGSIQQVLDSFRLICVLSSEWAFPEEAVAIHVHRGSRALASGATLLLHTQLAGGLVTALAHNRSVVTISGFAFDPSQDYSCAFRCKETDAGDTSAINTGVAHAADIHTLACPTPELWNNECEFGTIDVFDAAGGSLEVLIIQTLIRSQG